MATQKVSEMAAAVSVADADLVPIVQGGVNKKATVDLILDALTAARVATAIGSTAANLVYAGPASGASAVPAARSLVPDDIPASLPLTKLAALTIDRALVSSGAGVVSVSSVTATELGYVSGVTSAIQTQLNAKQASDATLTALAALDGTTGFLQQTGVDTFVKADLTAGQINTALTYTAADAANLNATNLTSGTIPDARFPATLPAVSGANLTNLPGGISGLTTNTIPVATSATAIGDSIISQTTAAATVSGADAATNTVTDVLILRHATSGTAAASFGTGLLFQGENASGTMRDMASIDAVYTDATNGSEDVDVVLRGFEAGAELEFMRFREGYMGTVASISINSIGGSIDLRSAGVLYISPSGLGAGWVVNNPALAPYYTNTYDIGTPTALVRQIHAVSSGVYTANGAISNVKSISESITLSTAGATTDSTADLLPANAIIKSVVARITTTITTATDWALGDATTAARFAAANSTLTAGTTAVGVAHRQGSVATDAAGPVQIAAAKLRITTTGTPGAGVIRVTVFYEELTPPTS